MDNKTIRYIIDNELLMQEWHWSKNNELGLFPNKLKYKSNKKVWWFCSNCGAEWDATISNRTLGTGCPVCAGKRVISGINDLATTHPNLIKEWHSALNKNINPSNITPGSDAKAWWICEKGHEWEATIRSRTIGCGCPVCSNKLIKSGFNDLCTTHPHLINEWSFERNIILPNTISAGSNKIVWWTCSKCKNEWKTSIYVRSSGSICPKCAKLSMKQKLTQKAINKHGALSFTHPELAKEWSVKNGDFTPDSTTYGSDKLVWWICSKGHEWEASISSRAINHNSCPICSFETQTSFPEQAILFYLSKNCKAQSRVKLFGKEVDIFLPEYNIAIEYNGRYFHKNRAEFDRAKIEHLTKNGIRVISINESTHNSISDDTIFYHFISNKIDNLIWAIEQLFYILSLNPPSINLDNDRINIWAQYTSLQKKKSIEETNPEITAQWNYPKNAPLLPSMFTKGSHKKVWWRCKEGHEYQCAIYSKISNNISCPICSGKSILPGYNDLSTINPTLLLEWDYSKNTINPNTISPNSHKYAHWICPYGHKWEAQIKSRNSGTGCPTCYKNKFKTNKNAR